MYNVNQTCKQFQEASRRNRKDPLIPRELPVKLWNTLETDLFTFGDHSFLLVVDVMSRFAVLRIISSETTKSVLNALKGIYCDFGLPYKVISDNGPCFKSAEFREFHRKLGIITETRSAYNLISVGFVEHMVQTVKQIMTKNPDSTWFTMLIFRATPIPDIHKSPAELLNARNYRTNLPIIDLAECKMNKPAVERLIENRELVTKTGKDLSKLDVGKPDLYEKNPDRTKIKCPQWSKGAVKNCENPRKHHILADDSDRVATRSRCHIKAYFTRSGRASKAPKC